MTHLSALTKLHLFSKASSRYQRAIFGKKKKKERKMVCKSNMHLQKETGYTKRFSPSGYATVMSLNIAFPVPPAAATFLRQSKTSFARAAPLIKYCPSTIRVGIE